MYTYEQRMAAVKLYIQYYRKAAAVIRELGYPNRHMLVKWFKEYESTGDLHKKSRRERKSKFSDEQKQAALQFYQEHGCSIALTINTLGYPGESTFKRWLNEAFPNRKKHCISGGAVIKCSQEKKEQAVIDLCSRSGSAAEVAQRHGVSRVTLYQWKNQLLNKEPCVAMPEQPIIRKSTIAEGTDLAIEELRSEKVILEKQIAALEKAVYRLQLERDVLERATEVLKKDEGINLNTLRNCEKAEIIGVLRKKHRLNELLQFLHISKSSYCYQAKRLRSPDKYAALRTEIHTLFRVADGRYGYRRIHASLKNSGILVSEKVVRRLMKEDGLIVQCIKRKKYNSYVGEISPAVPNLVNRNFHADAPNTKWLTDITEFSIPAGKVYLSPIIDCFDGLVVAWSIGTSPSADLANSMLDKAIALLGEEHPIIHSDRGGHYRWTGWIDRMKAANLTRSMSKKGCSPDNSACEGFFGRLKNEMFYGRSWKDISIEAFMKIVDEYIHWYNEIRIKESLGWMSSLQYRRSIGLV